MNLKITAEWLHSFDDDDYEPSGLMTPHDRAELERRQAERQPVSVSNAAIAEKEHDLEEMTAAAK